MATRSSASASEHSFLRATDAESAARVLREYGVCYVEDVLSSDALERLRDSAQAAFSEVLRTLTLKQVMRDRSGEPPEAVRYAEVVERDGGRYDVRYRADAPPFTCLFASGGAAEALVPLLQVALGADAEVISLGQVVAMSMEGWIQTLDDEETDDCVVTLGAQAWHTDGPLNLFVDDERAATAASHAAYALNVFLPLVDLTESNGATEFIPGSHLPEAERTAEAERRGQPLRILAPAGSAVIFDYRLWHRGLANDADTDRAVLYAVVARSWYRDSRNHQHTSSLFGGTAASAARLRLGLPPYYEPPPLPAVSAGAAEPEPDAEAPSRVAHASHTPHRAMRPRPRTKPY